MGWRTGSSEENCPALRSPVFKANGPSGLRDNADSNLVGSREVIERSHVGFGWFRRIFDTLHNFITLASFGGSSSSVKRKLCASKVGLLIRPSEGPQSTPNSKRQDAARFGLSAPPENSCGKIGQRVVAIYRWVAPKDSATQVTN